MKNIMKCVIACAVVVGLAASMPALSYAKGRGKGKEMQKREWKAEKNKKKKAKWKAEKKRGGRPYGWSRGRKTGWRGGSYPPGWSKWNGDKREEWKEDRVESVQRIDTYLVRYEFPERQSEQVVGSFDQAIAGGMAINEASRKIISGLKDGDMRRNLMIDAAQTSLDLLR